MNSSTPKAAAQDIPERIVVIETGNDLQAELSPTASKPSKRTLSNTIVVHAIPGRIRLRVQALKSAPDLAGSLEAFLKAQPGMTDASVNCWCHSVTVTCDPMLWTADRLCAFLQPLRHEDIMRYESFVSSSGEALDSVKKTWIQPTTYWTFMGCVTLVLGIVLLALPMVPGGVPFLVLSGFCFAKATTLSSLEAAAI